MRLTERTSRSKYWPMTQSSSDWEQTFSKLFQQAVTKYKQGHQKAAGLVDAQGQDLLKSIGHTEQEFFDLVEDSTTGEPTLETVLKMAAVRRDYFLQEQKGQLSSHRIDMGKLPPKDAKIEGIDWLPRIIPKAEAKLRGEMPPELMYGCGGDRHFFRTNGIEAADFLKKVWQAKGNQDEIISWVKGKRAATTP